MTEARAYPASLRPAQEGDFLYCNVVKESIPISLRDWQQGYSDKPLPIKTLNEVIGDYDVVLTDARTHQQIHRSWGMAYIPSVFGAELITYSTEDAQVVSTHEHPENPEKRVLACLAEAIAVCHGARPSYRPNDAAVDDLTGKAASLWAVLPEVTQEALLARYRSAPLLLRWPAPEWENIMARAVVRCALQGGKPAGQRFQDIAEGLIVPSWTMEEGL